MTLAKGPGVFVKTLPMANVAGWRAEERGIDSRAGDVGGSMVTVKILQLVVII
jgi:hypothetical protein